jgi:hypothetical protein
LQRSGEQTRPGVAVGLTLVEVAQGLPGPQERRAARTMGTRRAHQRREHDQRTADRFWLGSVRDELFIGDGMIQ